MVVEEEKDDDGSDDDDDDDDDDPVKMAVVEQRMTQMLQPCQNAMTTTNVNQTPRIKCVKIKTIFH